MFNILSDTSPREISHKEIISQLKRYALFNKFASTTHTYIKKGLVSVISVFSKDCKYTRRAPYSEYLHLDIPKLIPLFSLYIVTRLHMLNAERLTKTHFR